MIEIADTTTLEAIGALWKLALVIVLAGFGFVYRKSIGTALERLTDLTFRRGDTEFKTRHEAPDAPPAPEEEAIPPEQTEAQPPEEATSAAPQSPEREEQALIKAVERGDTAESQRLYEKLLAAETTEVEKRRLEGWYAFLRFNFGGDREALTALEHLTGEEALAGWAHYRIGQSLMWGKEFTQAASAFKRAIEASAASAEDRIDAVVNLAKCLQEMGDVEEALVTLQVHLLEVEDDRALTAKLYRSLATVYEGQGDFELEALAAELAVFAQPNDTKLLFTAAYARSKQESEGDPLALAHYKTLLGYDSTHAAALNNSGVQYELFGMPIKSVESYRAAVDRDSTLAAANLANRLLTAGFLREADELLKAARAAEKPHPNVGTALARASKDQQGEREKERTILATAREMQAFYRDFARAYFVPSEAELGPPSEWRDEDNNEVTLTIESGVLVLAWESGERIEGKLHRRASRATHFELSYSFATTSRQLEEAGTAFVHFLSDLEIGIMTVRKNDAAYRRLHPSGADPSPNARSSVADETTA